jgi:NADH:ubiquinone oxidoreductase subunit E
VAASLAPAAPKDNREKMLERAMSRHQYSGAALIEVLHTAQELFGYLSPALLKTIARKLKLPPSRVLGVASFYHFFPSLREILFDIGGGIPDRKFKAVYVA